MNDILAESKTILDFLSQRDVLKDYPLDLLKKLADAAEILEAPSGTKILEQDQRNEKIYFLMSGTVRVLVDDNFVAEITDGGILGEMSVISDSTCSATTIAESTCKLIVVDSKKIKILPEDEFLHLHLALYKLFSHILTNKLVETNNKAKYVEDLNTELENAHKELTLINSQLEEKVKRRTLDLENQNAELKVSHRKIEELYSSQDVTFNLIEDLYANHLKPLYSNLDDFDSIATKPDNVSDTKNKILDVIKLLEPIAHRYNEEQSIKDQRVLFADPIRKQQVVAKMALGGTGVKLKTVSNFDEGKALIDEQPFDIVFVSTDTLELAEYARSKSPDTKFIFISSDYIPDFLPHLEKYPFITNVVSRDTEDKLFTIKNIMTTITKLTSQDIFGVEKYLAWGSQIIDHKIISSQQRPKVIQSMLEYFQNIGARKSHLGHCQLVAEEILMNSIYDAPVDKNGTSLYNHLDRTEVVQLAPEHQSTFRYGADGVILGISVTDPFGALDMRTILRYLNSCYSGQSGSLNKDKGGAGRGLHQIIENSDLVVFNVRPRNKTEVIALFNMDPKSAGEKHPSFHFFS